MIPMRRAKNIENLLERYAQELGLSSLTVEALIASHRHLRTLNLTKSNKESEQRKKIHLDEYRKATKEALKKGYFSKDDLLKMSLEELLHCLLD